MSSGLVEYFGDLPDPRVRGLTDYPLKEIVFLCISATHWRALRGKSDLSAVITECHISTSPISK